MPVNQVPDAKINAVLACDQAIPEAAKPIFYLRHLVDRESRRMQELFDKAGEEADLAKAKALVSEAIGVFLIGWNKFVHFRGKPVKPGTPPEEFLTTSEIWELIDIALGRRNNPKEEKPDVADGK